MNAVFGAACAGALKPACPAAVSAVGTRSSANTTRQTSRSTASGASTRLRPSGLKDKMLAPDLVATFVEEFREEWDRRAGDTERRRAEVHARMADCARRIAQVMAAIEQGIVTATTKARRLELEAERDQFETSATRNWPQRASPTGSGSPSEPAGDLSAEGRKARGSSKRSPDEGRRGRRYPHVDRRGGATLR